MTLNSIKYMFYVLPVGSPMTNTYNFVSPLEVESTNKRKTLSLACFSIPSLLVRVCLLRFLHRSQNKCDEKVSIVEKNVFELHRIVIVAKDQRT